MKTAESFYAMIEFTDPFPYMTQSEDYIVMCLQTAQRVLFSGEFDQRETLDFGTPSPVKGQDKAWSHKDGD